MFLKATLITLRTSMWFIPMLLVAGAVGLAHVCISIDQATTADFARYYPQPFAGGADSVRMMLSAIATSMITVSGITFSLTISSLAQVSGQLTARVIRNFVSNVTSKLVLGFFVGLFLYCLIVMRTIRLKTDPDGAFVPALSVAVALGMAVVAVGAMIYFIHYVAQSIQASTVISSVATETLTIIDKLYPDPLPADEEDAVPAVPPADADKPARMVPARANGYVQLIDTKKLIRLAADANISLWVEAGAGDFVTQGGPLVSLIGLTRPIDDALTKAVNGAFSIRPTRTIDEEAAFGIRQLVDITLKTQSPASPDITTTVVALDFLTAVLVRLVQRRLQPPATARFLPRQPSFADFMANALDQARDGAGGNVVLLTRLLVLLQTVGRATANPARRAVLLRHTRLVAERAATTLHTAYQRGLVRQQLADTLLSLGGEPAMSDDIFGREHQG
jgi:uncharacterized membrane protein